ncbi:unnamed protein product [Cuscuta campestris]|uniref:Uncharacterized protein n=1 Tax=Cuscuta campestris TaxID=132261 RepID=A0A484LCD0_9ASTE|nr:unnamed protein product [Cuscuta campestris]
MSTASSSLSTTLAVSRSLQVLPLRNRPSSERRIAPPTMIPFPTATSVFSMIPMTFHLKLIGDDAWDNLPLLIGVMFPASPPGRLELIRSVIQGIEGFWFQAFPIHKSVLDRITSLCRTFLWGSKFCKVAWEDICKPKDEGGLGLNQPIIWNQALLSKNLWNIASNKETLWVQWVHSVYLDGNDFWTWSPRKKDSHFFKKLTEIRDMLLLKCGNRWELENQLCDLGEISATKVYDLLRTRAEGLMLFLTGSCELAQALQAEWTWICDAVLLISLSEGGGGVLRGLVGVLGCEGDVLRGSVVGGLPGGLVLIGKLGGSGLLPKKKEPTKALENLEASRVTSSSEKETQGRPLSRSTGVIEGGSCIAGGLSCWRWNIFGGKMLGGRYHLWFDMDTINWILDSLSLISKRRCWVTSLQDSNRRIEVRQGFNRRGNYIQIIERRSREGMRFLLVPFDSGKDGPILFIRALSSFIQRASKSETNPVQDMDQSLSPTPDMELATSLPSQMYGTEEDDINTSSFKGNGGSELIPTPLPESIQTERHMVIYEGTEPKFNISKTYTDLFTHLSRKMLSPYAPLFVPLSYNPFAALDNQDHEQDKLAACLEDEDLFSKLNEQSMVLSLNAVEDHTKERDGLILYTHSEGEDIVFIDSIRKPLQIDLSRCSKHPLYLRKELKGRKIYSPSQIVTRSKAKLLEIGRRITPIGWEEEEDLIDPQESHEEELVLFEYLDRKEGFPMSQIRMGWAGDLPTN